MWHAELSTCKTRLLWSSEIYIRWVWEDHEQLWNGASTMKYQSKTATTNHDLKLKNTQALSGDLTLTGPHDRTEHSNDFRKVLFSVC